MRLLKFIIFLLIVSNLYAQNLWYLKAGLNVSKFRDDDSEILSNYSFGLSKQIHVSGNYSVTPEIFVTRQGSILKDKPVKTRDWDWYLYSYNIKAIHIYIEIPILLSYKIYISDFQTHFYAGPSYRAVFTDRTKLSNQKIIYDDTNPDRKEEFKNYNFEFVQGDYEGEFLKSPAWSMNLGASVDVNIFKIECRYTYTFNKIGQIGQLHSIDRYLYSIHLLLGMHLGGS